MKRGFTIIILIFLIIGIAYATEIIFKEYKTEPGSNRITITFETKSEAGVAVFQIMRSLDDRTFYKIADVKPHGVGKKYEYIDKNVFKTNQQTFFYKIRARRQDDTVIEETLSMIATPNISGGINQTWGAIKSMFNR